QVGVLKCYRRSHEFSCLIEQANNALRVVSKVGIQQRDVTVKEAGTSADDGLRILCGRIRHGESWGERSRTPYGLAGQAATEIDCYMAVESPMVLNEYPAFRD